MTALQKAALRLLDTIGALPATACDNEVTEKLILLYASLAPRACSLLQRRSTTAVTGGNAATAQGRTEERRGATLFFVGSAAAAACAALFGAETTKRSVRAKVFESTVRALGEAMLSRHRPLAASAPLSHQQGAAMLWKAALSAFNTLLHKGLEAISEAAQLIDDEQQRSQAWAAVLDTASEFLFPARESVSTTAVTAAAASALEIDQLDVTLVDALVEGVIRHGAGREEVGKRLVQLLLDGGRVAARGRERLCRGCYHGVFELASVNHSRADLVAHTAPLVVARARDVVAQFLAEDRGSGAAPVQRSRLVEMLCVLREAHDLKTIIPTDSAIAAAATAATNGPFATSQRRHLLVLYPLLCECVTTPETEIKAELRELLELVGTEFLCIPKP